MIQLRLPLTCPKPPESAMPAWYVADDGYIPTALDHLIPPIGAIHIRLPFRVRCQAGESE